MTGVTTRIRPAAPRDAPAIAQVHVETWRAAYAGLVPDRYLVALTERGQTLNWQRHIAGRGRGGAVLVAEARGPGGAEVVGFGSCGGLRGSDLPYRAEIYTLYVAPDWQGRGLGRDLLGGLFNSLLRAGLPSAYLWVLSGNPARFFYEQMAGRRVGERKERFAGSLLDETAYAWTDLESWAAARA